MLEEVEISIPTAPRDKYLATYSILVLLGCGFLFPYNSFITAVDYFTYLYPDHSVEFAFPAVYTISLLITMGLMVKWGRTYSFGVRIVGSFICFLVVTLAVPLADLAMGGPSEQASGGMFYGTLLLLLLTGIADSIVQASLYGFAGMFPSLYIQAIQNGNGVAGLMVSLLRVVTKASVPDDIQGLRFSSLLYFFLSAVTMLACILAYFVLVRLPFTKYYLSVPYTNQDVELSVLNDSLASDQFNMVRPEDVPTERISVRGVVHKIWKGGLAVGFTFFITLLGFPGLMTSIPASGIAPDWYPIILITVFNLFDFVGKTAPGFFHTLDWAVPKREQGLFITSGTRIVFIFIFVTCVHVKAAQNEVFVILVVAVFGLSNGFLGATLMMSVPAKVSPPEREVAGSVSAFFLVTGLTLGASSSWAIEHFVKW